MIFLIGQVGGEGMGEPVCPGSGHLKIDLFPHELTNTFGDKNPLHISNHPGEFNRGGQMG